MKDYLIFSILLYICKKKTTNAREIAKQFDISSRSVYRYIDSLSLLGVPVITKTGRTGGIELIKDFYIDKVMLSDNEKNMLKQYLLKNNIPENIKEIIEKIV